LLKPDRMVVHFSGDEFIPGGGESGQGLKPDAGNGSEVDSS